MKAKTNEGAQFVRYFGPLLEALRQLGGSATPTEASSKIAENLLIPQKQQDELLESGSPRFHNQVQFARFYLVREGLIDGSKRGIWALTPTGWKTTLELVHGDKLVDMFENLKLGLIPRMSYDIDEAFFDSFQEAK